MLNNVTLIGRLTRDPELRYTAGEGVPIASFTLAVDRAFKDKVTGESEADFIDIKVWRKQAEACAAHLKKGRLVAAVGRLQISSYEDSQGIRRKGAEVVADDVRFLSPPPGNRDETNPDDIYDAAGPITLT